MHLLRKDATRPCLLSQGRATAPSVLQQTDAVSFLRTNGGCEPTNRNETHGMAYVGRACRQSERQSRLEGGQRNPALTLPFCASKMNVMITKEKNLIPPKLLAELESVMSDLAEGKSDAEAMKKAARDMDKM